MGVSDRENARGHGSTAEERDDADGRFRGNLSAEAVSEAPVMLSAMVVPQPPAPSSEASEPALRVAEPPDDELVQRVAAGDSGAFDELVHRYQDKVYGFCLRMLDDPSEAEDVAQDVFLTLYRHADRFRGESQFSTWLFRIAKNQSLNRIKYLERRGRQARRALGDAQEDRVASIREREDRRPDALVEGEQRAALVQQAIAALGEEHRVVLVLRDLEDLSYDEISAITGLPIGTVKSRIHRGRTALAERLSRLLR